MTPAEIERASAAELASYRELARAYVAMAAGGGAHAAPLSAAQAQADAASIELRRLATLLAPQRLGGEPVPARIQALWQASALLAADAAEANAALVRAARARQTAIAGRLAQLGTGRRALRGYRPATPASVGAGIRV
jgi:hypothetical protein